MRYTLLLHYPEASEEEIGRDAIEAGMAAFRAYADSLDAAGVLRSAEVLQPSSASTTVRLRDGELAIQDGPFADTKEQLGGTFVIDVDDLDAALAWAKQAPSAQWGPIEVRPSGTHWDGDSWV
jgi:hypothetical protein